MNRYGFALIGSISAILSARLYVSLGGSLNFSIFNHTLHHFYYGLSLLVVAGLLRIRNKVPESLIFFVIGLGLGFVTDEFNLLVNIGQRYTLAMYDNPVNLAMDTFLLIALMKLSQPQRVLYYLPEREI